MTHTNALNTSRLRVLIADDAPAIRNRLSQLVTRLPGVGLVLESANYVETMRLILREKPDLILLDLFMPGGTGLDVLQQLRDAQYSPIVIVLTAWADHEIRKSCLEAGADYFFSKNSEFLQAMDVVGAMAIKGNDHVQYLRE